MSDTVFSMLIPQRLLIKKELEGLSPEFWTTIPPGFRNNILWNVGHLLVSQQALTYRLSGLPMNVPEDWLGLFVARTSPSDWATNPDPARIVDQLIPLAEKTIADAEAGLFTRFTPYRTSAGVNLGTLQEAVTFNHFHEGLHAGIILTYRRLLTSSP